jgi:aminoglycoside phosphotransferase family enzyme/predicted kinase
MTKQAPSANRLKNLLGFMQQPDSYSHQPAEVQHIQTHISHVFMAGPFVYKLKKPVDFGFLDYSTLELRRKYCRNELELNRRLTDDIYISVVSIVRQDDGLAIVEDDIEENVVEYAVKMRKLSEQYFLHTFLADGSLRQEHLDRVVQKLSNFYDSQQPDNQILKYGDIDRIKVNTNENFEQTHQFVGDTISRPAYEAIQYYTEQYFEQRQQLFQRRIAEDRIVDGHGDLHLEHIHITPEKVQIYDCIEFNDRFRYGDLAVDLAYLAMDLDFNDRWADSRYVINEMADKLDDPDLTEIIDFYKCYRAYVKGKAKSLQSTEDEVPKSERKEAAQTATSYFDLSLRYALLGSTPKVLAFMGRVGTGKSTLARRLQSSLNVRRFSTDRIRKALGNMPLRQRTPAVRRDELYSASMSARTYNKLMERARATVQKGMSVILDGTFNSKSSRKRLQQLAHEEEVELVFIEAQAPDAVIKQRLRNREEQHDVVSDARLEDFEKLDDRYEPPEEVDDQELIRVNTDGEINQTITQLYTLLADRQCQGSR